MNDELIETLSVMSDVSVDVLRSWKVNKPFVYEAICEKLNEDADIEEVEEGYLYFNEEDEEGGALRVAAAIVVVAAVIASIIAIVGG